MTTATGLDETKAIMAAGNSITTCWRNSWTKDEGTEAIAEGLLISQRRNEAKQKYLATQQAEIQRVAAVEGKNKQLISQMNVLGERIAALEAEKRRTEELSVEKQQLATIRLAVDKSTALDTAIQHSAKLGMEIAHFKQRIATLENIEKEHVIIEARSQVYKEHLDTTMGALAISEERAWTLNGKLRGTEIYLKIAREREEIIKRVLLAIFVAVLVAKLIGAT